MKKKILIIGSDSKLAKIFIEKFNKHYIISTTKRTALSNLNEYYLDLSSRQSVLEFISTQKNIKYDAVIVFASVYNIDAEAIPDYLDRIEIDSKINVFHPITILRSLNYNHNSTIILFGDSGTKIPKPNYISYTTSKTLLLMIARNLAVELKDRAKVLVFRLGPTMAPENKNKEKFYEKNLIKVVSPANGLVDYCKFLIDNKNINMTGAENIYLKLSLIHI